MSLVSIGALHTCVLYMDCDPGHKFSKMQCFDCTCAESPEVGQILFEKSHSSLKPFTIETLYKPFIFSLLETSMHLNLSSLINSKYSWNPNNGHENMTIQINKRKRKKITCTDCTVLIQRKGERNKRTQGKKLKKSIKLMWCSLGWWKRWGF